MSLASTKNIVYTDYVATDEPDKRYISLLLDSQILARIDDYRFENRFPSRTEAIRHLLETALRRTNDTSDDLAEFLKRR